MQSDCKVRCRFLRGRAERKAVQKNDGSSRRWARGEARREQAGQHRIENARLSRLDRARQHEHMRRIRIALINETVDAPKLFHREEKGRRVPWPHF
jgi:hypothetical protein